MEVYIVTDTACRWDGYWVVAVFSTEDKANAYIKSERGSLFDPQVVHMTVDEKEGAEHAE